MEDEISFRWSRALSHESPHCAAQCKQPPQTPGRCCIQRHGCQPGKWDPAQARGETDRQALLRGSANTPRSSATSPRGSRQRDRLEPGTRVRVIRNEMNGVEGVVIRYHDQLRVLIRIDVIPRGVLLAIADRFVEPLD